MTALFDLAGDYLLLSQDETDLGLVALLYVTKPLFANPAIVQCYCMSLIPEIRTYLF